MADHCHEATIAMGMVVAMMVMSMIVIVIVTVTCDCACHRDRDRDDHADQCAGYEHDCDGFHARGYGDVLG